MRATRIANLADFTIASPETASPQVGGYRVRGGLRTLPAAKVGLSSAECRMKMRRNGISDFTFEITEGESFAGKERRSLSMINDILGIVAFG
jgi:hypothetical protein